MGYRKDVTAGGNGKKSVSKPVFILPAMGSSRSWRKDLPPGIFRINFKKANLHEKPVPGELVNSATLRMVRDMDQHKDEEPQGIPRAWTPVWNQFRTT